MPKTAVRRRAAAAPPLPGPVTPLPVKLAPQLATLAKSPPAAGEWIHEIKFDGYRLMVRIEAGKARFLTRNGNDWTPKLASLAVEVEALGLDNAWLDGEAVVMGANGTPDFNALQNAFDVRRSGSIVLYVFDAPFFESHDLRALPVVERRALLQRLFEARGSDRVRFSEAIEGDVHNLLRSACEMQLEGIMAKRADAPYVSARTDTWLKLKCGLRQEFIVVGFTDRSDAANQVGSLLLGYHQDGVLRYGGSVGTGWNSSTAADLRKRLEKLRVDMPPVDPKLATPGRWSKRTSGAERWVKPEMVVEVSMAEWTPDGLVRHASFKGVRTDKPAIDISRERPRAAPAGKVGKVAGKKTTPSAA